mmetsp:Transcript_1762/g.3929  ORF Transcript_1762/g.3929 Transcript_1762/m.3929 type:complete len:373 (-) Transcript_1762:379-1497(-)
MGKDSDVADLPVFDLAPILEAPPGSEQEKALMETCEAMADCLHKTSCLVVKDPRVSEEDNKEFLRLMQRYYAQSRDAKLQDARPDVHYQVGVTPDMIETAVCARDPKCLDSIAAMAEDNRPLVPKTPDPKWRFFWRMGDRPDPENTKFPDLNAAPVVPQAFQEEWKGTLDHWGNKTLGALKAVSEMLALGMGLERSALTSFMEMGGHLLAPTGSNLAEHGKVDTIFAGYHNDLNYLSIHGKSNFPGLRIWLRDGSRRDVAVPDGCLLIQAGQQMEYLTGGWVKAGMHEVVVTEKTVAALETKEKAAEAEGRKMTPEEYWRISTTMFGSVNSDAMLQPVGRFAELETAKDYPPILGGDQVAKVLKEIGMVNAN